MVAQGARDAPHVLVDRNPNGRYQVNIEPRSVPTGEDLILVARGVIEPTLTCLQAIAAISGVSLLWDGKTPSLQFAFPEPPKASH
jgi:hypothetical protein